MAEKKKNKNKESETSRENEQVPEDKRYEKLIRKLQEERKQLQDEIGRDYREARRYVRSHPEEGVLIGFIGGIALGVVLGRLMK